jgi:hypothetical protein
MLREMLGYIGEILRTAVYIRDLIKRASLRYQGIDGYHKVS